MALDYKARYRTYLQTEHWQTLRQELFTIRGRHCAVCSSETIVDAHHVNYRDLTDCIPDDLLPLCRRCHDWLHDSQRASHIDRYHLRTLTYPERVRYLQAHQKQTMAAWKAKQAIRNGVALNSITLNPDQKHPFKSMTYADYKRHL